MDTQKMIIAIFLWIGIGQGANAQPDSVKQVLDSSITLLRTHALHRQRPDWDYVRERAYELAGEATRWEDLGPAISWLFEAVDDHHGGLAVGDTLLRWERSEPPFLSEALRHEWTKGCSIIKKMLPGGIGYLRVPGGMSPSLRDSLFALETEGARKLILDLRLTTDGAMLPMLEGISPLLGNGYFLGNADCTGKILDMIKVDAPEGRHILDTRTPVVVLTGHGTGRAGESIAVAFRGRKHTIFIGEPTAGYTTANDGHLIVDGKVAIVMAETMLADRKHRVYPRNLIPDEWVPGGDDLSDYSKDKKIQAAIRWLEL
ncbi:MAG TPA: S41 family peptidase [Puia sp.]|nr:S41 family peptidase [Puia sp.]